MERRPGHDLIGKAQLEASAVVANSAMNRERRLEGVNSYQRELGFSPFELLTELLTNRSGAAVAWLDVGCGRGRAVVEAALRAREAGLADRIALVGLDLVDFFEPMDEPLPGLELVCASVASWEPSRTFQLITSVHSLHYVGDKLGALSRMARWLTAEGLLIADLDLASIRLQGGGPAGASLARILRRAGFELDLANHRVLLRGGQEVDFPYRYDGADDAAGPNYTGQPAVHSYYRAVR